MQNKYVRNIFMVVAAFVVGMLCIQAFFGGRYPNKEVFGAVSAKINKSCPMAIDSLVILKAVKMCPDNVLRCVHTIDLASISEGKSSLDMHKIKKESLNQLVSTKDQTMLDLLSLNPILIYEYTDQRTGNLISSFILSAKDYGKREE